MVKTIEFEGAKVKYDDSLLHKWSFMKKIMDPQEQFSAMDDLLVGKSDEVASKLNDSMDKMTELLTRIVTIEGNAAKN